MKAKENFINCLFSLIVNRRGHSQQLDYHFSASCIWSPSKPKSDLHDTLITGYDRFGTKQCSQISWSPALSYQVALINLVFTITITIKIGVWRFEAKTRICAEANSFLLSQLSTLVRLCLFWFYVVLDKTRDHTVRIQTKMKRSLPNMQPWFHATDHQKLLPQLVAPSMPMWKWSNGQRLPPAPSAPAFNPPTKWLTWVKASSTPT